MSCRNHTPEPDGSGNSPSADRTPLLDGGDSLFTHVAEPVLPAMLVGGRRARHLLLWEGYFEAADLLLETCLEDPRHALRLVYPILFTYRHATDLLLRYIIESYGDKGAPRASGLLDLSERACGIIEHYCMPADAEITSLRRIVAELHTLDPDGRAFLHTWPRMRSSGKVARMGANPQDREDVYLDLAKVRATMTRVRDFLDEMDGDLMNCGFDLRD